MDANDKCSKMIKHVQESVQEILGRADRRRWPSESWRHSSKAVLQNSSRLVDGAFCAAFFVGTRSYQSQSFELWQSMRVNACEHFPKTCYESNGKIEQRQKRWWKVPGVLHWVALLRHRKLTFSLSTTPFGDKECLWSTSCTSSRWGASNWGPGPRRVVRSWHAFKGFEGRTHDRHQFISFSFIFIFKAL